MKLSAVEIYISVAKERWETPPRTSSGFLMHVHCGSKSGFVAPITSARSARTAPSALLCSHANSHHFGWPMSRKSTVKSWKALVGQHARPASWSQLATRALGPHNSDCFASRSVFSVIATVNDICSILLISQSLNRARPETEYPIRLDWREREPTGFIFEITSITVTGLGYMTVILTSDGRQVASSATSSKPSIEML